MASKQKTTFSVVDEDGRRRSLYWRFVTHKSDVFIGPGGIGQHKLTLHESGICRWAFTSEYWDENVSAAIDKDDRVTQRWNRPQTPEAGAVLVQTILIPGAPELAPPPPDKPATDIVWNAPVPGRAVRVLILFSRRPALHVDFPGATPIAIHSLANGEYMHLVGFEHDFDLASIQVPDSIPGRPLPGTSVEDFESVRGGLFGTDEGVPIFIDLPAQLLIPPERLAAALETT